MKELTWPLMVRVLKLNQLDGIIKPMKANETILKKHPVTKNVDCGVQDTHQSQTEKQMVGCRISEIRKSLLLYC